MPVRRTWAGTEEGLSKRLIETLARAGVGSLHSFAGRGAVDLLEKLESRSIGAASLARIVVDREGASAALRDPALRLMALESLRREEAIHLCAILGLPGTSPFDELLRARFDRSGMETLHAYFGVSPEGPSDAEPIAGSVVVPSPYPLFRHQHAASLAVRSALVEGDRRVLLHMPTGSGKTRTAWTTVVDLLRGEAEGRVVLWLAHSEELCGQAFDEACRAWAALGSRDLAVRRHYGQHRIVDLSSVQDGIVVGGLQLLYGDSLARQGEFLAFARRLLLIVLDEAHQAIAPTYSHLIELLQRSRETGILGLSATPGRSLRDVGADQELARFFRHRKVKLEVPGFDNAVEYLTTEGYLAAVEYVRLPFQPAGDVSLSPIEADRVGQGFELPARVVDQLEGDDLRNLLIIEQVVREVEAGGNVILFAVSVEHANLLASVLKLRGVPAASVTGSTPRERRRQIIARYRDTDEIRVLCNYGVLTTGFDAPKTNVAVIARPTSSVVLYSQMVGRAARGPRAGGNATCRVVTVVDSIPGFRSLAEGFEFWDDIWEDEE